MDVLVDGYNLLHYSGLARRSYGPGDLERLRHRLVKLVASGFTEAERSHVKVVFDAKEPPAGGDRACLESGIAVHFADPGREADDLIEDLIARHSAPKQLLVVSSDRRLQRAAKRRGAAFCDSDEFLIDLKRRRLAANDDARHPARRDQLKQQGVTAEEDLASWLNEFDDVEIARIFAEVDEEERRRRGAERQQSKGERDTNKPPVSDVGDEQHADPLAGEGEVQFWERRVAELFTEEEDSERDV